MKYQCWARRVTTCLGSFMLFDTIHYVPTLSFAINCCFSDGTFAPRFPAATFVATQCLTQLSHVLWLGRKFSSAYEGKICSLNISDTKKKRNKLCREQSFPTWRCLVPENHPQGWRLSGRGYLVVLKFMSSFYVALPWGGRCWRVTLNSEHHCRQINAYAQV